MGHSVLRPEADYKGIIQHRAATLPKAKAKEVEPAGLKLEQSTCGRHTESTTMRKKQPILPLKSVILFVIAAIFILFVMGQVHRLLSSVAPH
jgi:hypothetical protein